MTAMYKIQIKHLNEHSTLYGGQLLEWIDNYCLAKTETYRNRAGEKFLTKLSHCEFENPAYLGDLVTLQLRDELIGNTSITFHYEVVKKDGQVIAHGHSVFVKTFDDSPVPVIDRASVDGQ